MNEPKNDTRNSGEMRCSIATPRGVVPCKVGTQPWVVVFDKRRKSIEVGDVVSIREAGPGHKWIRVKVEHLSPLRVSR